MASNTLPQDAPSEKMFEHSEHTEDKNLEAVGAHPEVEEEPVVTFKTWIVVTVSVLKSPIWAKTISHASDLIAWLWFVILADSRHGQHWRQCCCRIR